MTIHELSAVPSPPRPARCGLPWEEADYEALVAAAREGACLAEVARRIQRPEGTVLERARRMLPPGERSLPRDHALDRLRRHLRQDEPYDWSAALTTPTPHVELPRPPMLHGIPGMSDGDLVLFAALLCLHQRAGGPGQRAVVEHEIWSRGLTRRVADCLQQIAHAAWGGFHGDPVDARYGWGRDEYAE